MTSSASPSSQTIQYSASTIERAARAVRCSPFQLPLFVAMQQQGVELRAIAGSSGTQHGYTQQPIPELVAENSLLWLIQVGLLRREVDGQGLTDSFRLTPLGHFLVEQGNSGSAFQAASVRDRLTNLVSRLRLRR